ARRGSGAARHAGPPAAGELVPRTRASGCAGSVEAPRRSGGCPGVCAPSDCGPQRAERTLMARSLFDLSGQTAVVVRGTSGIGPAVALGLADAGANVVATGRREALVCDVAQAIESRGRRTVRMTCDAADTASLARVRDACLTELGGVDIVVAAAGTTKRV